MKVEHVIVILIGAFLVYHMMEGCRCNKVEGVRDRPNCKNNYAAYCPKYDPDLCKWENGTWSVDLNDGGKYYYYPDQKRCRAEYANGIVELGWGGP